MYVLHKYFQCIETYLRVIIGRIDLTFAKSNTKSTTHGYNESFNSDKWRMKSVVIDKLWLTQVIVLLINFRNEIVYLIINFNLTVECLIMKIN